MCIKELNVYIISHSPCSLEARRDLTQEHKHGDPVDPGEGV